MLELYEQNVLTGVMGVNLFKKLKTLLVLIVYDTAETPPLVDHT